MLEEQGHGGFLSCAASQQQIIQHTKLLYRHVASCGMHHMLLSFA